VGDVVLFLHLVPMMAALALEPETKQDQRTSRVGTLDFALLLVWWVYLYLFAVIPWQYAYTDELAYSRNFNALYLTEKVAFLAGLLAVATRSKGAWRKSYILWFAASALYACSSYIANWGITTRVYYTGSLYDIPLTASMAAVSFVGIVSAELPLTEERIATRTNHGVWGARWGMIAIFSLPIFAAWSIVDVTNPSAVCSFRLVLTLGAIMAMGAMVFLRQHLLDRELIRLLRSSEESFANLKRLQVQLVQSEKLASLGQLVGGAAHELNNPLTAMLGYAELLAATQLNEDQRALADKIGMQVRRTKALVASLLSFAKQTPFEKSRIDVNALCQTTLKLLQPQLRSHNIVVRLELSPQMPSIVGDSNQLLQVCLHIITNALQALEEVGGGTITVSTAREQEIVVVEMSDSGPGAREPERVFDPFYTTKSVGKGVGLGLSACYGIIQEHGGRISCCNRKEGGASFRMELPIPENGQPKSAVESFSSELLAK
jgi:signal transduction histidine kinase